MVVLGEKPNIAPWSGGTGAGPVRGLRMRAWRLRERLGRYRATRMAAQQWDEQYRAGAWDWIGDVTEVARYSVVGGYVRRAPQGVAVLDVGCGEGLLLDHLGDHVGRYVGVDLSAAAVERAGERRPGWQYVVGDAESLDLDRPALAEGGFDVIVFNECLYYFDDPVAVVQRYKPLLAPDGVLVVSMYVETQPAKVWAALRPHVRLLDEVVVAHETGKRWTVRLVQV